MRRKSATSKNSKDQSAGSPPQPAPQQDPDESMIVAIGASAGGIEATTELMRNLPPDTGMAFVLIQPLDPKHHSILTQLISKETTMRAFEAHHAVMAQSNHAYLIPRNATMCISPPGLHLRPPE